MYINYILCKTNIEILVTAPLAEWLRRQRVQSHSDLDGVGSIPAIPDARYVPSLLCHERYYNVYKFTI